ncbi:MAG: hypothetical protein RDU20_12310 [Desulfomonilaceae bacterium]|nr:hypothetical protein [Desulfomonilaceae bacterium]
MPLTNSEFAAIMEDQSKKIVGDLDWCEDEDHSPSFEFRAQVFTEPGWPLFVRGSYNPLIPALSYMMILKTAGRVYGLDLGKDHHNPACDQAGEKHKHRWSEQFRDKEAYIAEDIRAPVTDPVEVWREFCSEAKLTHEGELKPLPPGQGDLF